jgi:hypothetical protein
MFVRRASLPAALVLLVLTAAAYAAPKPALATWYVDASAATSGTGSRTSPFLTIQEGIDAAATATMDTVQVAPGVYVENIDFLNKRVAVLSELGPDVTTIDGALSGPCVRITGPIDWGQDVQLVGFTVTNGSGEMLTPGVSGGGLLIADTSPLIDDCRIVNNEAELRGGGIYAVNSSALILDCVIDANDATSYGQGARGGGAHVPATVTLDGCLITGNSSITVGGGVQGGTLVDCTVDGNTSAIGGGLYQSTATDCTITGNIAQSIDSSLDVGGGAALSTLTGCLIEGNRAETHGGGADKCTLVDCVIRGNQIFFNADPFGSKGAGTRECDLTGCAVYQNVAKRGLDQGLPASEGGGTWGGTATRTTIYENFADDGAGAYGSALEHAVVFFNTGEGVMNSVQVHNSIVFSNWFAVVGSTNVTYSDIEGGHAGVGNLNSPPAFWAPFGSPTGGGHDFYLKPWSPCINVGDPSSPTDPDGSIADMGAFPFETHCVEPVAYCTAKTNSIGCVPAVSWTGEPSLSGGPLVVNATQVLNNKTGLLFWGADPLAGSFQGGIKCVAAPTKRTGLQNSGGNPPPNDCSGVFSYSFDPAFFAAQGLVAGQEVHAQFWSRDPQSASTTGLTDAIWFIICP